jgi:hypothetical protein
MYFTRNNLTIKYVFKTGFGQRLTICNKSRYGKMSTVTCFVIHYTIHLYAKAYTVTFLGEEICTSYKSPTLGNIARKPAFKSLWNFDCTCLR